MTLMKYQAMYSVIVTGPTNNEPRQELRAQPGEEMVTARGESIASLARPALMSLLLSDPAAGRAAPAFARLCRLLSCMEWSASPMGLAGILT